MKNEIIGRQIDSLLNQRESLIEKLTRVDRSSMNGFDSVNDINMAISNIDIKLDNLTGLINDATL